MIRSPSLVTAFAIAFLLLGCDRFNKSGIVNWTLSPDGSNLVFDWCGYKDIPCTIALYHFKTDKLYLYPNKSNRSWRTPRFSSDGQFLAFSIKVPGSDDRQIAIMNADGSGMREVTKGKGFRAGPAFSIDNKKLTYRCAVGVSERHWTPYRGNVRRLLEKEICVLNVSTSREKKISNLGAYSYSNPFFMPDGENVLFYYEKGFRNSSTNRLDIFEYNIVQHIENIKTVTVLSKMPLAHSPRISRDGRRIVFSARTNEMDGATGNYNYDLFLWEGSGDILNSKGTVRRLTKAKSYLSGFGFSADGRKIAYAFDKGRNGETEFFLMDVDGGGVREFSIPEKPDGWVEPGLCPLCD